MRVERVKLENYRAFDYLELSFKEEGAEAPHDLVALTGVNGSGKTTVLEAIHALARSPQGVRRILDQGAARRSGSLAQIEVAVSFAAVEIQAIGRGLPPHALPSPGDVLLCRGSTDASLNQTWGPHQGAFQHSAFLNKRDELEIAGQTGSQTLYYDAQRSIPAQRITSVQVVAAPETLDWEGTSASIKQFLVNLEFVRLKRLESGGPDPFEPYRTLTRRLFQGKVLDRVTEDMRVVFRTDDGLDVDFDDLSSGERAVFGLVGGLFRAELPHSIFLIDEPEQHLHPIWQAALPGVLKEIAAQLDSQFILATHSVEIAENVQTQGGVVFDLSPAPVKQVSP